MIKRFEALDAWRGICACLIVLTHFNEFVVSHIGNSNIVTNAFPLVDFFFVLSGFVIAGSYQQRILTGFPVGKFIVLRFGRIYPLHLFMLLAFVALELVRSRVEGTPPFGSEYKTIGSLIANIFLLQSMGILDVNTWNLPSWSISAEFYTYIVFAFSLLLFRQKLWIPSLIVVLAAPLAYSIAGYQVMDLSYDFGFFRCIYGFSAGILCHALYVRYEPLFTNRTRYFSLLEILTFLSVFTFLYFAKEGVTSLFAPYLFSVCVLVFSLEKGILSRLVLKSKPFIFLGALSYSIYMIHYFLQRVLVNVADLADKVFKKHIIVEQVIQGYDRKLFDVTLWQGDIGCLLIVALTILASWITYTLIERPANEWFRRRFAIKTTIPAPAAL